MKATREKPNLTVEMAGCRRHPGPIQEVQTKFFFWIFGFRAELQKKDYFVFFCLFCFTVRTMTEASFRV
jgi:hypothetical protein